MSKINLNTIISGAVGSGRNYVSLIYSIAIIDDKNTEDLFKEPSDVIRKRFNELSDEGQILQVAFNKNYRYEDFLEEGVGVDPRGQMMYTNGALKVMSMLAKQNIVECLMQKMPKKDFQVNFNQLYKSFIDEVRTDKITNFYSATKRKYMVHKVEPRGNFYIRGENSFSTYYISRAELKKVFDNGLEYLHLKHDPKIKTITGTELNPEPYEAVYTTLMAYQTDYMNKLMEKKHLETTDVGNFDLSQFECGPEIGCKKYVFIIDHMDDENAGGIFGDTISLLEENRRAGKSQESYIYLPVSKVPFNLPPNLYIIGLIGNETNYSNADNLTLFNNFDIIKIEPNSGDVWKSPKDCIVEGIDMFKLISIINRRMDILLPGTFAVNPFIFKEVTTFDELKTTFETRLIPQLERALGGDLEKLKLVIGKDFVTEKKIDPKVDFMDYDPKKVILPDIEYRISKKADWKTANFKRIYIKS